MCDLVLQHAGVFALLGLVCGILQQQLKFCEAPKPRSRLSQLFGLSTNSTEEPFTAQEHEAYSAAILSVTNLQCAVAECRAQAEAGVLYNLFLMFALCRFLPFPSTVAFGGSII